LTDGDGNFQSERMRPAPNLNERPAPEDEPP
jgi:hypothetical protein